MSIVKSDGSLGWTIRTIIGKTENGVMFEDGISFGSPVFSKAKEGQTWAVKYQKGKGCFGAIKEAVLLEEAQ